jgi:chromosome segregation ATPase
MENDDYEIVTPQEFINGIVEKVLEEHAEEIADINDNIEELDIRLEDNFIKIVEMLKEITEVKQLINNTERNRINTTLEAKLIRNLQEKNTELDKKITLINHIIVLLLLYSVAMLLVF